MNFSNLISSPYPSDQQIDSRFHTLEIVISLKQTLRSPRQLQIVNLVLKGYSPYEIQAKLGISRATFYRERKLIANVLNQLMQIS